MALPTTWDELQQAALALTDRQGRNVTRLGYSITFTNQQFFPVLWQNGGEVLTADWRQPALNASAGVDALTYWVEARTVWRRRGPSSPAAGRRYP